MERYHTVLSIAGSDCSGGAGIQADMKTCSALGTYAMSVIAAITAQNTQGVRGIMDASPQIVEQQIDAVFEDIVPDAVKIGMLSNSAIVEVVARRLAHYAPRCVILDPVMVSTSGCKLIADEAIGMLMSKLVPIVTLVTPNRYEAQLMAGMHIETIEDIRHAAMNILDMGAKAVLIKGGHFDDENMTDYLFTSAGDCEEYKSHFIATANTHGTGCTYSSAIASFIALGYDLKTSIARAKEYLTEALTAGANVAIGRGHGPVNHFYAPLSLKTYKS